MRCNRWNSSCTATKAKNVKETWRTDTPAAAVEPLSEQFDRRLRAVELFCWHVHVVHKQDELLPGGGAENALPSFFALAVDQVLE